MGYFIQPITIWSNGEAKQGNYIDASIVNDNLENFAQFYWQIMNVFEQGEEEVKTQLAQGNVSISGDQYIAWGESADINLAAYEYICEQLNLTLIP